MEKALDDSTAPNLLSIKCTIPELNQNFDVYRVGTLLECVRELTTMLSARGKRCKVCVQQSLGQGVFCGTPLALSGVRRILNQMDWGEDEVAIGQLGRDQIDECDAYVIISPQNTTGNSVVPLIAEMVEEADGKDIILINPQLADIMSSGGVMSVRGRQERMDFISEFIPAYHFRLLYIGMGPYPIMGALRYVHGGLWEVYRRVDYKEENDGTPRERYDLLETFETEPDSKQITEAFKRK
jgi:adenylate kinase